MTTTVHPRGAPLRIVSYGGGAQFLNPDAAGRYPKPDVKEDYDA
jgi:hypothetical protein